MNSIGVDFKLKNIEFDSKNIKLQIWDTAGQERFRTITTSYYRGAQAIVIVYDITDRDSFEHVKNWMVDIDRFAKENVLRVLIGNKNDLDNKRVVQEAEGRDLGIYINYNKIAKLFNIQFMETSAKNKNNVDELFTAIVRTFLEKSGVTCSSKKYDFKFEINQKSKDKSDSLCC